MTMATATTVVEETSPKYFVYLLESSGGATYVGATVNVQQRLRRHNREIVGGAHATSIRVQQGETWHIHCFVQHFPTWASALQFEWRWKQLSRKKKGHPMEKRMLALTHLLSLERSTTKAIPYAEWPIPPEIVVVESTIK
jgi:predicted GIY-YIG superfamily endonuclease